LKIKALSYDMRKIYNIDFNIDESIFINKFSINEKYRKRGYSKRIINSLYEKYKLPIYLHCFPTLLNFYKKIGFEEVCKTFDDYIEMKLKK
jgi:predicted GNAT family N-acyltransferase